MTTGSSRPGFVPDPALELLIQAVLCDEPRARTALAGWSQALPFDDIPNPHFRLMGELAAVIDRIAPGFPNRTRVMGMHKYVWSNNVHILRMALPAVDALTAGGIGFIVLKGGGIIARDPAALQRRYIRDLDLMVREADVPAAAEMLLDAGWRPATGRIPGRIRAQPFDKRLEANPRGQDRAEIDLHRSALHCGRYGRFDEAFFERTVSGNLLSRPVEVLHPTDYALVAGMHGLSHDPDPTFAWLTDAVRTIRHPDFNWDGFRDGIERRRIGRHLAPVLDYLERTFGIGLPAGFTTAIARVPFGWLFDAEIAAMAASRSERGLRGRAAMAAAELVRSGAATRSVPYRTDFSIRMKRLRDVAVGEVLPAGAIESSVATESQGRARIEVSCGTNEASRLDLDVWAGERWVARLKLRTGLGGGSEIAGVWSAEIDLPAKAAGTLLSVVAALNTDNDD